MNDHESSQIIYFDNAATSYPLPPSVVSAVKNSMVFCGGNPGRGAHTLAMRSTEEVYACREELAEFFSAEPENVVFTLNTTHALNMAIKGLLGHNGKVTGSVPYRPTVVIGDMEHNSVLRPVSALADEGMIRYRVAELPTTQRELKFTLPSLTRSIDKNTAVLILAHSSNICSRTLPLSEIGAYCKRNKIIFVVDAAQSAGHENINMREMNIDILCIPGHKGLLGPMGSGAMILGDSFARSTPLGTLTEGGNGVNSRETKMPDSSPERYESGTLPLPAISGLREGLRIVKAFGTDRISEHEKKLFLRASDMLSSLPSVKIYAPDMQGGVLLFNIKGKDSDTVSGLLNERGIAVRSGFHCTALGHKRLHTGEGGAVRMSFGIYNTMSELEVFYRAMKEILFVSPVN